MYKQWFASRLIQGNFKYEKQVSSIKEKYFSKLTGTVIEIGPGAGENLKYYPKGIKWIGIEPNIFLHKILLKKIKENNIHGKVLQTYGEDTALPDKSVNAVVTTLVLCSVASPQKIINEIYRILKKNGLYIFIEHSRSENPLLYAVQCLLTPLWMMIADGCHPARNLYKLLYTSQFRDIKIFKKNIDIPIISSHLYGIAKK